MLELPLSLFCTVVEKCPLKPEPRAAPARGTLSKSEQSTMLRKKDLELYNHFINWKQQSPGESSGKRNESPHVMSWVVAPPNWTMRVLTRVGGKT